MSKEENKGKSNKVSNKESKDETKVNDSVKVDNTSTEKKSDKSLPKTGSSNDLLLNIFGSILLVASLVGFTFVFVIRRRTNKK